MTSWRLLTGCCEHRTRQTVGFAGVCCIALAALFAPAPKQAAADGEKVVIPFDFVSKFDDGVYGEKVGDMIWKKLEREGGFIIPETMLDVRDFCSSRNLEVGPDMPLDKVKKIVQEDFGADIGIWGSVERAPGHQWDVYDLVIHCVDFSVYPEVKVVYECNTRTKTVSEIPHLYVKQMLDNLYGRKPGEPPPPDPIEEENWKNNANLVNGGDFERGKGGVPYGWDSRGGQHREPLGNLVKWIPEVGNTSNKVIRFTFDKGVGDGYGVMYYSDPFPVEEGAKYRFQCRYRTNGPAVKVFIKCYDVMDSEYTPRGQTGALGTRRANDEDNDRTRSRRGARGRNEEYRPRTNDYIPEQSQMRECYRSQQNLKGAKNQWNLQTEDFTPKHTKYTPKWGRVMLYAYLGGGVVEFDDVVIKQIMPASPSESIKRRRHSMESTVTIKEMEENERRGSEVRQQMRREEAEEEADR